VVGAPIWHSAGVLCLVIVVGLFGWHLIRQIELRTTAEAELTKTHVSLKSSIGTLERLAMQDGLTGLANRRQFDVTLHNEFSRATRHASALGTDHDGCRLLQAIQRHLWTCSR